MLLNPEIASRMTARYANAVRKQDSRLLGIRSFAAGQGILVKSWLMLVLGEKPYKIQKTLTDLKRAGCSALALGQYLAPSKERLPVKRYVPPEDKVRQVFLNRSAPASIGFSSIGEMLPSIAPEDPFGVYLQLGKIGAPVKSPIAPEIVKTISVKDPQLLVSGEEVKIPHKPCVVALGGAREVEIKEETRAAIRLSTNGPVVVDLERTIWEPVHIGEEVGVAPRMLPA
jgi:hypothetical protein